MKASDILTVDEAKEWNRIDYDEKVINDLIDVAYDIISDTIDDFIEKLKSAKFRRKLKLCMMNSIVDLYNSRGTTQEKEEKLKYINQTMLIQLKYGGYSENDE